MGLQKGLIVLPMGVITGRHRSCFVTCKVMDFKAISIVTCAQCCSGLIEDPQPLFAVLVRSSRRAEVQHIL